MLLGILLAVLMVVCVALIAVILLQRSEGGAFGMTSGGPGAFMTARGTGDFLTRTTEILVAVFFGLCLLMTIISSRERNAAALIEKMKGLPTISAAQPVSAAPAVNQAPAAPTTGAPSLGTPATGAPLNLLGNTPPARPAAPVTMPAPAFQPPLGQPTLSSRTAKTQPHKGAPASAASSPPAPIVAPPPVVLPPPPAAPANQ